VTKESTDQFPMMHEPSIYDFRVRGHLEEKWSDHQLGGFQITATQGASGKPEFSEFEAMRPQYLLYAESEIMD
jgi:hypothetical protein